MVKNKWPQREEPQMRLDTRKWIIKKVGKILDEYILMNFGDYASTWYEEDMIIRFEITRRKKAGC